MKIKFNKKVVAFTAGLTVLSSPLVSFAEEQQSINNKQPTSVQEQGKTDQLQTTDEQALKSIEASFEKVDGRGENTFDNVKANSFQHSEGIHEETGTLTVPNNLNRSLFSASPSISSTINGVPFTEWIVPAGNDDIRPQNHMSPKYITIHETANTNVGSGAKRHAQYLYNQAVGKTDRAASWHFTVDDKEIYQHLPLNEIGRHAGDGDGPGNRESIAIEIAVNSDGDYNKTVDNAKKLVAYLMKETGVPLNNIVKHQRWSGKNCPANMINNGKWDEFVNGVWGYYNNLYQPKDDITGGWYEQAIRELNRKGIMVGEGNGVFAPNRAITRAEFAQLISISLKLPAGDTSFKDLNEANSTLREGIKRTASAGIIVGRGDGFFDPNTPITREESAIIVNKALQYKGIWGPITNLPFSDQDQISYKEDVQKLYGLGIVKGKGDNQYDPKGTTTRGETATFILNMLQVIENGSVQNVIGTAQINGIGVNVRSGSGTNDSIVRKISKGEKVTVYEEKNGWLRIGTGQWIYYDSSYIIYTKKTPIKDWLLPLGNSKDRTNDVTHVMLHFMSSADTKPQAPYNADDLFNNLRDLGLSSHYMIDRNGEIYKLVDEKRVAYHAGKGSLSGFPEYTDKMNEHSIGIELFGIGTWEEMSIFMSQESYNSINPSDIGFTDAQYLSLNALLNDIYKRNPSVLKDRNHVIGHDEYAPGRKTDPGSLFNWSKIGF